MTARLVLDFSRRRSNTLAGSATPGTKPGAPAIFDLSPGLYRLSSTGPYFVESAQPPSTSSFYGDEVEALEIQWPGGRMALASASGKACNVHVVPLVRVDG